MVANWSRWDHWARSYRLGKVLFVLIAVSGLLIWFLYTKESCQLVRRETVWATLEEIKRYPTGRLHTKYGISEGYEIIRATLKLPDGKRLEIPFNGLRDLEPGVPVPLVVEYYSNGERLYFVDRLKLFSE